MPPVPPVVLGDALHIYGLPDVSANHWLAGQVLVSAVTCHSCFHVIEHSPVFSTKRTALKFWGMKSQLKKCFVVWWQLFNFSFLCKRGRKKNKKIKPYLPPSSPSDSAWVPTDLWYLVSTHRKCPRRQSLAAMLTHLSQILAEQTDIPIYFLCVATRHQEAGISRDSGSNDSSGGSGR